MAKWLVCAFHFTVWMQMSRQVMLCLLGIWVEQGRLTPKFTGIQTKSGTQALPKRLIHTRTWLDDEPLDFDGLESEVLWVDYARRRDVNYCGQMVHWRVATASISRVFLKMSSRSLLFLPFDRQVCTEMMLPTSESRSPTKGNAAFHALAETHARTLVM